MPTRNQEVAVSGGLDAVAVGAQVEVVGGVGVPPDAAPVALAQKVAAELCGARHVGDVLAQTMAQEGFHLGAVVLEGGGGGGGGEEGGNCVNANGFLSQKGFVGGFGAWRREL